MNFACCVVVVRRSSRLVGFSFFSWPTFYYLLSYSHNHQLCPVSLLLNMWFTDLSPSDVTFKEELKLSEATLVLLVDVRGHTCVMKVVSSQSCNPMPFTFNNSTSCPLSIVA